MCPKNTGQVAKGYVVEELDGERVLKAGTKYQGVSMYYVSNVPLLVTSQPSRLARCPSTMTIINQTTVESIMNYPV